MPNLSKRAKRLFPKLYILLFLLFFIQIPAKARQKEQADSLISKEAFTYSDDKSLNTKVYLLSDQNNRPYLYAAHIATGVCSDGLCKPVNLMIYWDLLGNFQSYSTPLDSPLTKFDHLEFTQADHQKLKKILADRSSILKDYESEDLVDKSVKVYSNKLDAVTGATSKTFQDVIVPGAVYTVHTLWHITNGALSDKILAHTKSLLNDQLLRQLLASDHTPYKEFVLNHLSQTELNRFTSELIRLIGDKDVSVPHFAMAKLPQETWSSSSGQEAILKYFALARLEVQNTMLLKFSDERLSNDALRLLLVAAPQLNKTQLQKVLMIVENNKSSITEDLRKELLVLTNQPK